MNKVDRAAILLFGMGEQQAADILKHMSQKQVEKIIASMNKLGDVTEIDVLESLNNFFEESHNQSGVGVSSQKYIRNTLVTAIGQDKATSLIDKTSLGDKAKGLEVLSWQLPQVIVDIVEDEHPQVLAIILNYLDSEKAAKILQVLPKEKSIDILKRMTHIGPISPVALEDLAGVIEQSLTQIDNFKELPLGGVSVTANIVNYLDSEMEHEVLNSISEGDEELANKIQEQMFPFEKLASLDDRGLQTLLREISNDDLVVALKGVDQVLQELFFKNMSERAGEMLKDDLEVQGPIQLSKVQDAQKKIVATAQRMAKEGQIVIGVGGDDMVM